MNPIRAVPVVPPAPPPPPEVGAAGAEASSEALEARSTDLGLLLLTLVWGANFSVAKWALESLSPLAFNALRFPLAALFLYGAVRARPGMMPRLRGRDLFWILFLGVVGNGVYQLFFIYGLEATRAGNAALLLATTPVWTVLLSALVREDTLDRWVVLGILATLGGMSLVVIGSDDGFRLGGETFRGDLLMILAALCWAGYTVGSRKLILRYGALPVTAWTLWGGTAILTLIGIPDLLATDLLSLSPAVWGAVGFAGILSLGVSYLIWYRGVQRLGSARTAAYSNLVPVVALVIAWIALGEVPRPLQWAGAGVILGGVFLARFGARFLRQARRD